MDFWRVTIAPHTALATTLEAGHGMPIWAFFRGEPTSWIPHVQEMAALLVARCYGMLSIGLTPQLAIVARNANAGRFGSSEQQHVVSEYATLQMQLRLEEGFAEFMKGKGGKA